jgi:predicted transcriptional regulator YdeE
MPLDVRDAPFQKSLYGVSKPVPTGQKPGQVMFAAMDSLWGILRAHAIPNAGINHILYNGAASVFAGVELESPPDLSLGLQHIDVQIPRYAYYRHVGPYDQLGDVYRSVHEQIAALRLALGPLSLEIYGHWDADPSKLVTEILITLK